MGIFDIFNKNKKPDYDPLNVKVTDLRLGFVFDYNLESWIVKEEYEYDWGDNCFTREFKITNGDKTAYLHVEDDDEVKITISDKIKIRKIDEDLPEYIRSNGESRTKLVYNNKTYFLDKESPGFYRDVAKSPDKNKDESWTEFISWDYYDESEKFAISIEQWGENEFDASVGEIIEEFKISNIIPK